MEWQPIETAPKRTKHIMGFGDGDAIMQCIYVMLWRDERNKWECAFGGKDARPTHWMPLPPPPESNT